MRRSDAGFSLIEAVVALTILGLSLSVAFSTLSQGIESASRTRARADMMIIAENLLTRTVAQRELTPIRQQGFGPGPYLWRLTIEPRNEELTGEGRVHPLPDAPEHVLFTVRAEISPSDGRDMAPLVLETYKTAWIRDE